MENYIHNKVIRQKLYDDDFLGVGNFLFKVIDSGVKIGKTIFYLEDEWVSPSGKSYKIFTYESLLISVMELVSWYQSQGVSAGDAVCIYTSEGISQFIHTISLTSIKAIPCPVNCSVSPETTIEYCQEHDFNFIVIDKHKNSKQLLTFLTDKIVVLNATEITHTPLPAFDSRNWPALYTNKNEVVMIFHSIDTCEISKATPIGHQQFFLGVRERLLQFAEQINEKMLTSLPHSYPEGFSYLMTAVLLGIPTMVLTKISGQSVIDNVRNFRPTIMASFPQAWVKLKEFGLLYNEFNFLLRCYNTDGMVQEPYMKYLIQAAPKIRFCIP